MNTDTLSCSLSTQSIVDLIRSARQSVCYAAPGIQPNVAQARVEIGNQLGPEMLTVCLDFDERVMRMGYGEIGAVQLLRDACVSVRSAIAAMVMSIRLILVSSHWGDLSATPSLSTRTASAAGTR